MASFLTEDPDPKSNLFKMDIFFEAVFLISMIVEFLTDYQPEQQGQEPIRDPILIAKKYIYGGFIVDLFALIPFTYFIQLKDGYGRLFYLVRVLRLKKGFQIVNVANIMQNLKLLY